MEHINKKLYFKIIDNNLTVVLPENYKQLYEYQNRNNCFKFKIDYPLEENIIYNTKNGFFVNNNVVILKEIEKTQEQSVEFTFYTVSIHELENILALSMETNKKNEGYMFVQSHNDAIYLGGSGRILKQEEQNNGYHAMDMGFIKLPKNPGLYYLDNVKAYSDYDSYEIIADYKNIILDNDKINVPNNIKESLFEYLNELYSEREDMEISFEDFFNQYNICQEMLPSDYKSKMNNIVGINF